MWMPVLICVAINAGQCTLYDNLGDISRYSLNLYASKSACERAGAAAVKRWSKDGSSYSYYCLNISAPSLPPQSPASRFQPAPAPDSAGPSPVPEPPGRPAPDGSAVAEPPPAAPTPRALPPRRPATPTATAPVPPAAPAPPAVPATALAPPPPPGVNRGAGIDEVPPPAVVMPETVPEPTPAPASTIAGDRPVPAEPAAEPPAPIATTLAAPDVSPPSGTPMVPSPRPSAVPAALAPPPPNAPAEPSPPVSDAPQPAPAPPAPQQGDSGATVAAKLLPEPPASEPLPGGPAAGGGSEHVPADASATPESHHLPWFVTAPGSTDYLFNAMGAVVIAALVALGSLFFKLHALPERWAHNANPIQLELVAVLSLIALFTHQHVFWVAALLLALVRFPDYGTPLRSMSESLAVLVRKSPRPAAPGYLRASTASPIVTGGAGPRPARDGGEP